MYDIRRIGTDYAKYLGRKHNVPVIPIHHMEAHALTVRMIEKVLVDLEESRVLLFYNFMLVLFRSNFPSWYFSYPGATLC